MGDFLSDLMYEAHELGVRKEVFAEVARLKVLYPSLPLYEVYELAFENIKKEL
jgi:hypothetical protein